MRMESSMKTLMFFGVCTLPFFSCGRAGYFPTNLLADDISTLSVLAAATMPSARSITVNGEQQVDSTAKGLYLAVFDLTNHQVYDESVDSYRTRMAFCDATALQTVLSVLSDTHVVLLVSTGDITAMSADVGLSEMLKSFGASRSFELLGGKDSYALIGGTGLGEGNGLEHVTGVERGGFATIATVVVNMGVMGIPVSAAESDPTVNMLGKAALSCAADEIAKFDGNAWVCAITTGQQGPAGDITGNSPSWLTATSLESTGDTTVGGNLNVNGEINGTKYIVKGANSSSTTRLIRLGEGVSLETYGAVNNIRLQWLGTGVWITWHANQGGTFTSGMISSSVTSKVFGISSSTPLRLVLHSLAQDALPDAVMAEFTIYRNAGYIRLMGTVYDEF